MSRLFLMPSSVHRAINLSGLLHPVPSSSWLRTRGPTAAVSWFGPALRTDRCSSCGCCMVEDSRVRPEPPLGPNKHLLLLLLEFLIWISKESHGDAVRSLTGSSHVGPNWLRSRQEVTSEEQEVVGLALTQVSRRQLEISPDVQDMTAAVLAAKLTDPRSPSCTFRCVSADTSGGSVYSEPTAYFLWFC